MILVIKMCCLRDLEDSQAAKLLAPQSRRERPFRHQAVGHLQQGEDPTQLIDPQRSRQALMLGNSQDVRRHDTGTRIDMRKERLSPTRAHPHVDKVERQGVDPAASLRPGIKPADRANPIIHRRPRVWPLRMRARL